MNTTHHKIIALLLGAGLLGLSGMVSAAITDSKHDFSSLSGGPNTTDATDETCVFCHTPHRASNTTKPLWNKGDITASYTPYSSTTMDATAPTFTGSTSLACLSCHDGTQAVDNVINASGSGLYNPTGARMTGTWTTTGVIDNATGLMQDYNGTTITSIAMLNNAESLGDDHPIAIEYAGGSTDADFQVSANYKDTAFNVPYYDTTNNRWWFDVDTDTKLEANEVRLYTVGGKPNVECASCHDPHGVDDGTGTNIATFLRVTTAQSAVCTACHVK